MLETMREYASEKLDAHGERERAQQRHLEFFVEMALVAEPHLLEPDRETWLATLEADALNLRAAYEHCVSRPEVFATGVRLVGALSYYWLQTGYIREGRAALGAILERTTSADRSHARGKVLHGAAMLAWKEAEADAGARLAEEALSIFRERADLVWTALAEWQLAVCELGRGKIAESRSLLDDCLSLFRRAHHRWGEGQTFAFLGINAELRGDYDSAQCFYRASLAKLGEIHDVIYESVILGVLAGLRCHLGDTSAAPGFFDDLARIIERATNRWVVGRTLQSAAFNLQYNYHLYDAAKVLYQGSLLLWRDIQRLESGFSIVQALVGIAEIAEIQRDVPRAGWLFGAADHLASPSGVYRDAFNQRAVRARQALAAAAIDAFDAAWHDGYTATVERTIEVAMLPMSIVNGRRQGNVAG
jgi:hypothetical protein